MVHSSLFITNIEDPDPSGDFWLQITDIRRLPKLPSFHKTPENRAFLSYQSEIAEK